MFVSADTVVIVTIVLKDIFGHIVHRKQSGTISPSDAGARLQCGRKGNNSINVHLRCRMVNSSIVNR